MPEGRANSRRPLPSSPCRAFGAEPTTRTGFRIKPFFAGRCSAAFTERSVGSVLSGRDSFRSL